MRAGALLLAVLAMASPAAAQGPKAPEPAGPASYHGVRWSPGDTGPRARLAAYQGEPLLIRWSPLGHDAFEPTIGVDRDGTAFYAASSFDDGLDGLGFVPKTKILRSDDGGGTWTDVTFKTAADDTPPLTLDPYVYVDTASGRVFSIDNQGAGSFMTFSDDKGETWTASALTSPGINDHQTVFSGPPPAEGSLQTSAAFPNVVYYCVNHMTHQGCAVSADGGLTFAPSGAPAFGPCVHGTTVGCGTGHGVVDSAGRAFLPRADVGEGPEIAISEDGARSWRVVRVADGPGAAFTHTAMAVDADDNLYYVWFDLAERLPYLSHSRDHGRTWSRPLMVAPPGVHDVNFPEIDAGAAGRIALAFPGTTVDDQQDDTRPWNAYMVVSTDALDADPRFLSNIANPADDPVHRGECLGRCPGMFDFIEAVVSPADGTAWATMTDTCTTENACSTTRGASLSTDEQAYAMHQTAGPRLHGPLPTPAPGAVAERPAGGTAGSPSSERPETARPLRMTARLRRLGGRRILVVSVRAIAGTRATVTVHRNGRRISRRTLRARDGRATARIRLRRPGVHRVLVRTPSQRAVARRVTVRP